MLNRRRLPRRREPWQREHELSDAVLTLLLAAARYGSRNDDARLGLLQHVTILLAHAVGARVARLRGHAAARAFRTALARRGPPK